MTVNLETTPLNQQVASELRIAIRKGQIKDGQRLQLSELTKIFHISQTPIKEGLMMLEHEGLVQHEKNKDFVVIGMSEAPINDYFDLRKVFEAAAIKAVCKNHENVSSLLALQDGIEKAGKEQSLDTVLYKRYSGQFHSELWRLSGNTRIIGFLNFLFEGPGVEMFEDPTIHWNLSIKEHRSVLDALQTGDAKTAIMRNDNHLERCRTRLIEAWKKR